MKPRGLDETEREQAETDDDDATRDVQRVPVRQQQLTENRGARAQ